MKNLTIFCQIVGRCYASMVSTVHLAGVRPEEAIHPFSLLLSSEPVPGFADSSERLIKHRRASTAALVFIG
jgi:hypothetical protein